MTELPKEAPSVLAEDLIRRYRNGRGLGPVSLAVARGEVVALVGPNGSGKTTLLRCLATRSRPGSGTLSWFGDASRERARERLSVVFDSTAHADELSALDNLSFFAAARNAPAAGCERELRAASILQVEHDPVSSFSFGMRRRLSLAEALIGEPELLLLDEPTLGLDVEGRSWLAGELSSRVREGAACCLSTNDTDFVEQVATRVCFLLDGRVVRDSPLAQLLSELGGLRRIGLRCSNPPGQERLLSIPGVERVSWEGEELVVFCQPREGMLAALLSELGELDRNLEDLSVRDPGLADCFAQLTGRSLGG